MKHSFTRLRKLLAGTAASLVCGGALAQTFPSHAIQFIFTGTPASPVTTIHRTMAAEWGKRLGQSVVMDFRNGATGRLGVLALAQAKGDGHVITAIHSGIAVSLVLTEP